MAQLRDDWHGREARFRELYGAYYAPLCLYAYRFTHTRGGMSAAEDIVADVFAVLWERLPETELRGETAGAYLRSAVRNRCLNYLRHKLFEEGYSERAALREPVYASAPDALYTLQELYELLRGTLERLPENYRTVFVRSVLEGRSHDEIAREMQVSVKSVGRYKQRALEELRRELGRYLPLLLALGTLSARFGGEL